LLIVQKLIHSVNLTDERANRVAILATRGISQCKQRRKAELTSHSFHAPPSCTHTFSSFMSTVQLLLYGMTVSYSIPFYQKQAYVMPAKVVAATFSCSSWMPSAPLPLPSCPAHSPTLLSFQSILMTAPHLTASSGWPIFSLPSNIWQFIKFHQLEGAYLATQSCCTFPAHSSGPCKHLTPKTGSEGSSLDAQY
jgi:hypothetical protein